MSIHAAAGAKIRAALIEQAAVAGAQIHLPAEKHTPWSSCCFRGGNHSFVLICNDQFSALIWLALLPSLGLRIPGFKVTDITVPWSKQSCGVTIATIDVLSIEEEHALAEPVD